MTTAPTPLTDRQRDLAADHLPLARKLARPLKFRFRTWSDDLESAACVALVEAARSYDPSRNLRFATFARFRIRGALGDALRGLTPELPWEALLVSLEIDHETYGRVITAAPDPPTGSELEQAESFERRLRPLPARLRELCRLYYRDGLTMAQAAESLGCSASEVGRLHRQAIALLTPPGTAPENSRRRRNTPTRRAVP